MAATYFGHSMSATVATWYGDLRERSNGITRQCIHSPDSSLTSKISLVFSGREKVCMSLIPNSRFETVTASWKDHSRHTAFP